MARKKTRKWANVDLPSMPQDELSDKAKRIFEEKDKRQALTMQELAKEYNELCAEDARAAAEAAERGILFDAIERRIQEELEKVQSVSGQDTWRGGELGTFSPKYAAYPNVRDKDALKQWAIDNGMENMLTLPKPKLRSIIAEAFDQDLAATFTPAQRAALKPGMPGSNLPPPGVEVFKKTGINFTGSKVKRSKADDGDDEDTPF